MNAEFPKLPSKQSIAKALVELKRNMSSIGWPDKEKDQDVPWVDVRLQVYDDGDWAIRWGDPSYDQDHRGHWGCGSLSPRTNCRELAQELLDSVD